MDRYLKVKAKFIVVIINSLKDLLPTYYVLLVVFIALVSNPDVLFAQEYDYIQYTTSDGLPTNYVYGVIEDDDGFIWAYTENGLAKFDGYTFKTISAKDGLPGNDVTSLHKDKKGRLWPYIYREMPLSYIVQDSVYQVCEDCAVSQIRSVDDEIQVELLDSKNYYKIGENIVLDTSNYYYLLDSSLLLNYFPTSQLDSVRLNDKPLVPIKKGNAAYLIEGDSIYFYSLQIGGLVYPLYEDGYFRYNYFTSKISWKERDNYNTFNVNVPAFKSAFFFIKIPFQNKLIFNINRTYLSLVDLEKETNSVIYLPKIYNAAAPKINHIALKDSSFLVSSEKGIIEFNFDGIPLDSYFPKSLAEEVSLLNGFKDSKDNLWYGTRDGGLFYIPAQKRKTQSLSKRLKEDKVFKRIIPLSDGSLLCFTDNAGIYQLKQDELVCILQPSKQERLVSVENISNNIIVSFSSRTYVIQGSTLKPILIWDAFGIPSNEDTFVSTNLASLRSITYDTDEHVLYGQIGVYIIKYNVKTKEYGRKKATIKALCYSPQRKVLYVGNRNGVSILENEQVVPFLENINNISTLYNTDTHLWIGTENDGLFAFSFEQDSLFHISDANFIRKIRVDTDSTLMVASNDGVIVVDSTGEQARYTVEDGLFTNETHDAYYDESRYIYVANSEGLMKLDRHMELNTSLQTKDLQLTEVFVNQKQIPLNTDYKLAYYQNTLALHYRLLSFESNSDITYFSKLEPLENNWRESSERSSLYLSLAPRDYIFYLKARDVYGNEISLTPLTISIRPAIWQTVWFAALMGLFLISVSLYIIVRRDQSKRLQLNREKVLSQKMAALELSALRAQMNPHFVFNALGSIQYYIQINEARLADEYLTSFAELMRKYLDSSKENMISLKDELRLLTLYTGLEQMRFEDLFTVEIKVSENLVIENIELPSMLIQPYVENAINHGLHTRSDGKGKLNIRFFETNHLLSCVIEDNGIGRENAAQRKRTQRVSRGMGIIQEKIHTLRESGIADIQVNIQDLYPDTTTYPGTKVTMEIQMLYDQDL